MRYAAPLLIALVARFGIQAFALRASGGRFTKSESNFLSSLGRILTIPGAPLGFI